MRDRDEDTKEDHGELFSERRQPLYQLPSAELQRCQPSGQTAACLLNLTQICSNAIAAATFNLIDFCSFYDLAGKGSIYHMVLWDIEEINELKRKRKFKEEE